MNTHKPVPFAGLLIQLQRLADRGENAARAELPTRLAELLTRDENGHPALVDKLVQLLKARQAVLRASTETDPVADELRRYRKFVKPGQPSPMLVRLRQQQAAVQQASSVARQRFVIAAAAFAKAASIEVPARQTVEAFIVRWIELNLPVDSAPPV